MIWFTSDWHFCHNKPFLYEPRGFTNINDMNEFIVNSHNSVVKPDDLVYCLGDCVLNDTVEGINFINRLNGIIFIVIGNHDTDNKINMYRKHCPNVIVIGYADLLQYNKKWHFYLSHYPTFTANFDDDKKRPLINLHGHVHSKDKFFNNNPYMYNVGMEAHNCYPVSIEQIIADIKNQKER